MTNKTVFILGSGFSKDVADLPLLGKLSDEVRDHLVSIKDSIPEYDAALSCLDGISSPVQQNIEYILTLLRSGNIWRPREIASVRRGVSSVILDVIADVIEEKQNADGPGTRRNWDSLAALIKLWKLHSSTIVTFNYDVLIELASRKVYAGQEAHAGAFYVGAFSDLANRTDPGSSPFKADFKIVKLHGSTNWYYSGNDDFSGEPIYFDSLTQLTVRAQIDDNKGDLKKLIIPPLLDKDPYMNHSLVRLQWETAYKAIIQASNIFVLGYSLPDTDLSARLMLEEAYQKTKANWHIFLHPSDSDLVKKRFSFIEKAEIHDLGDNESSVAHLKEVFERIAKKGSLDAENNSI